MAKMNNKTNKNWYDNNPFFHGKDAYDRFVEAMQMFAEEGELPKAYDLFKSESLTADDIKQFSQRFMRDTGLDVEFCFAICPDCGRLHCLMTVNDLPEDEIEAI